MALPTMIKELIRSNAYSEPPGNIELLQTHISYVILTDNYVFKIKKPVNFGFLDFSSQDKRRFYCQQEIELNKRLSPEVYFGVVNICKKRGHFFFGKEGDIVDYAVKMKRLPENKMMINLLKDGKVNVDTVRRIADTLAHFHEKAKNDNLIASFGTPQTIIKNVHENFSQTEKYIGKTIDKKSYETIRGYTVKFVEKNEPLLLDRVANNKIKDCHGDLHMEHLYIIDKIYIIDCIEFSERFRFSDVAADIAFLAMDLDFHNHAELSNSFVENYIHYSNDIEIMKLINFYKCYRAYVRGKVDSFELDDPALSDIEKINAAETATKYFKLAFKYAS